MDQIKLEAVMDDQEYEGSKDDAKDLVQQFLEETGDDIQGKFATRIDQEGNEVEELSEYSRHSEIWWTSVAILLISNPQGVIQFLKWAKSVPGLKMGLTMDGDSRLKIFSDNDFTLIDNSTNYHMEKIGEVDGDVIAKMPEEDWYQLYDDVYSEELDVDLPPEDEIGP